MLPKTWTNKCTWLVGDDINIDVIWGESDYVFTTKLDELESYSLFEEESSAGSSLGYKCSYTKEFAKENSKFFEAANREFWNKSLLIKAGLDHAEFAKKCASAHGDLVIVFDKLKVAQTRELIAWFIEKYKERYDLAFDEAQMQFVQKHVRNLHELVLCSLLKCVDLDEWSNFLGAESESWYAKMKDGTLSLEGLSNSMIPVMQYMLRAGVDDVRAGILQFLAAAIKDGAMVYEHNQLWKRVV